MQTIYPQLYKLKKYVVCLLSFLTIGKGLVCQVITAKPQFHNSMILRKMPMDTSPIRKAIINNHLRINPGISEVFRNTAATDTVISLTPYLKTKSDCDFEKTIDNDGCIIIKYNDGFIKKSCDGNVVEVITPDGKKYVSRFGGYNILMAVLPIPPPPDPLSTDTSYQWLNRYNNSLLDDIKDLLGGDSNMINGYMANEQSKSNGSIYNKIEFRTIFIEKFLEAK